MLIRLRLGPSDEAEVGGVDIHDCAVCSRRNVRLRVVEYIHDVHSELQRLRLAHPEDGAVHTRGNRGKTGVSWKGRVVVQKVQRVGERRIVIELEVDLLAGKVIRTGKTRGVEGEYAFVAVLFPAHPSIARGIQPVADVIVVRQGHCAKHLCDESR